MNTNFNLNPQNNTGKFKTILCKHFETSNSCMYKDKCQFAHGMNELRSNSGNMNANFSSPSNNNSNNNNSVNTVKKTPNPTNFKIVKCKNFEKGICKYGNNCTFAHGDTEVRSKVENSVSMQNGPGQNGPGNQFMPFGQFYDPNMQFWMQPPFLPMNTDLSQMQMFGNPGNVDPSNLNLNSNNGFPMNFNGEFQNNMTNEMAGMYGAYQNMNNSNMGPN